MPGKRDCNCHNWMILWLSVTYGRETHDRHTRSIDQGTRYAVFHDSHIKRDGRNCNYLSDQVKGFLTLLIVI